MKYVGVRHLDETWAARVSPDGENLALLAPLAEFWADPHGWSDDRPATATLARADATLVPIVPAHARVLCIGLNYRAHAAEGSFQLPDYPTIFGRWTASLSVDGDPVSVPAGEAGLDWEGEVAVYIGREVRDVDEEAAAEAIFGYSTFNDLTARRAQKLTAQWTLGKNADGSGPLGPLVTRDEVGLLSDGLDVRTTVNGIEVQRGNTRDMIFSPEAIISLVSKTLTLHPGDIICSGTPEGVGYVRTPPWLLNAGDEVVVEVERLGRLVTPVVERIV